MARRSRNRNQPPPVQEVKTAIIESLDQEGRGVTHVEGKTIFVDGARTLKRMRPAPQGRGYRVRKRSNHVTVIVDAK